MSWTKNNTKVELAATKTTLCRCKLKPIISNLARFHITRTIRRKATAIFTARNKEAIKIADKFAHSLVRCRSISGFQSILRRFGIIFGCQYLTPEVISCLKHGDDVNQAQGM